VQSLSDMFWISFTATAPPIFVVFLNRRAMFKWYVLNQIYSHRTANIRGFPQFSFLLESSSHFQPYPSQFKLCSYRRLTGNCI
jgi:hypothetical protein